MSRLSVSPKEGYSSFHPSASLRQLFTDLVNMGEQFRPIDQ